jgi:hypothetical protein
MANFDDLLSNNISSEQQSDQPFSKEEYAAKKQAERGAVYALADNAALEVSTDSNRFKQYLDVQAQFDRYSSVNALLIMAQKPEATRLGDFDYWKNQGGFVKQEQKGISILEPGDEHEREDGTIGVYYNIKKVFDVSQVDTRKVKSVPTPKYTERQLLQALISKAPMKITGVDEMPGSGGTRTDPETGEIQVLKGMEFSDTFRSVAYELCNTESTRADSVADPQFTAYCASYVLCKKYGVDTKDYNFNSAGHMLSGMDAKAVKYELSQIRDAANAVSGRMEKQLDAVQKLARAQEAR